MDHRIQRHPRAADPRHAVHIESHGKGNGLNLEDSFHDDLYSSPKIIALFDPRPRGIISPEIQTQIRHRVPFVDGDHTNPSSMR